MKFENSSELISSFKYSYIYFSNAIVQLGEIISAKIYKNKISYINLLCFIIKSLFLAQMRDKIN